MVSFLMPNFSKVVAHSGSLMNCCTIGWILEMNSPVSVIALNTNKDMNVAVTMKKATTITMERTLSIDELDEKVKTRLTMKERSNTKITKYIQGTQHPV